MRCHYEKKTVFKYIRFSSCNSLVGGGLNSLTSEAAVKDNNSNKNGYTDIQIDNKLNTLSLQTDAKINNLSSQIDAKLNGKSSLGHVHSKATSSSDGFMSAVDKTKLDKLIVDATGSALSDAFGEAVSLHIYRISGGNGDASPFHPSSWAVTTYSTAKDWRYAPPGFSLYFYEQSGTSMFHTPTSECAIFVFKIHNGRAVAYAIEWGWGQECKNYYGSTIFTCGQHIDNGSPIEGWSEWVAG